MDDLKFKCYKCAAFSEFTLTSENRDEVDRLRSDEKQRGTVRFLCTRCGTANEIELTLAKATSLLERLASDDPLVRRAIDQAKVGDYSVALDIARKKLGF